MQAIPVAAEIFDVRSIDRNKGKLCVRVVCVCVGDLERWERENEQDEK